MLNTIRLKQIFVTQLLLFSLLLVGQSNLAIADDQTITFEPRSITSKVEGYIPPNQEASTYTFDAQQGQFAIIYLSHHSGANRVANGGYLYMPSGEHTGNKDPLIYQGCLPETGTYKLSLQRSSMAEWDGYANYIAEVIILPVYDSEGLCQ